MSANSKKLIAFNYFGGKFSFIDEIYSFFPYEYEFDHLVELFAGSLVVSLNYKRKRLLIRTANEINEDITNFFEVLRNDEDQLLHLLSLTPCSHAEYNNAWQRSDDRIERARRFYVRVRQSFFGLGAQRKNKGWHMAKCQANSQGGETVSRWNNSLKKLHEVAIIIRSQFQITNFDWEVCLKKIDNPRAFFYVDPPYPLESRASSNDYKFEFSDDDHRRLADRLHNIEGFAMISGYECTLMEELYGDWEMRKLTKKKNNIRSGDVQEVVWMNYTSSHTQQLNIFRNHA